MQTVWKGSISFGLVSIPVRLVAATEEKDVSFRQVHAADGGRIRYKRVCDNGGHEVAYADIAKGYELPGGDMVVLDDEDLADLPIASSKVVEVQAFVPLDDLDPTALNRAYYAEPSADPKPYVLFRDALEKAGRVAIVKVALRNRERLAVLRPREGVLVVQTMLWPDEVRQPDFKFLDDQVTVRSQEMRMAESYIDAMAEEFEPDEYVDDYRQALLEVVQAKVEGAEITKMPDVAPEEGKVVDLMEALRRSVAEAKKQRGEGDGAARESARAPAKAAAKKAPAKKAAAKKASAKKTAAKRKSA
jgi:DNA end-binding protein Ku